MKKIIFLLIIIIAIGYEAKAEEVSLIYERDIFVNNNSFSLKDVLDKRYSELPIHLEEDIYFINSDKERYSLYFGDKRFFIGYISVEEEWGEADKETGIFVIERLRKGDSYSRESYDIGLERWKQVVEGLEFGGEVYSNEDRGISLVLKGKLLKGLELVQSNYQGIVKEKNGKHYFSGYSDGIDTGFNEKTTLQDIDYSSRGYSLGYKFIWNLDKQRRIVLDGENILSRINWEDAYTSIMNYENTSLGIYSNYIFGSSSYGHDGYNDYITRLNPSYDLYFESDRISLGIFYRYHIYDDYIYGHEFYPYFHYLITDKIGAIEVGIYKDFYTLGIDYRWLNLDVKSKSLNVSSTEGVMVNIGLKFTK
ncbi:hypothetical protein [Halonatronum saccharophilum]|uniref:hypothetical protein n=1 Tax=Halonatronum saccharophilum TaxID=150060 RepID=UPI000484C201|nr:hypothetical protein [Halonatronum saccharophilum]